MPALHSTVTWLDFVVFGVYVLASVAVGLLVGGKQRSLKTFLLAGHQMHPMIVAVSVLAALFSGITFLGAPGETYKHNLVYLWVLVGYLIATPVTTLVFLPFFYRLEFYTAYEFLEHRFDLRLRRVSSASFIFRVCFWLGLALYAPSLVVSEMMGIPLWISIVVIGACTMLYTTVGGMRAVIYTDVMQFCVLVTGIACVFLIAVGKIPGGLSEAWRIAAAEGHTRILDFNPSPSARLTVWNALIGGVFVNLVQLATDQISVQRYLTATSLKEAQKALWLKLAFLLPIVPIFFITGLILFAFYHLHPEMAASLVAPDRLLPNFVSHQVPSPIPGLLVAAILSATMSAVSSGLNSLTTATLMDFRLRKHEMGDTQTEARRVRSARAWTIFFGVVTTSLALVIGRLGTLVEASNKIGGFFGGPLLGIFFLAVFSRRANAPGALIGAVVGFVAVVAIGFLTSTSFMWYALVGCVVTYGCGVAASLFYPPPNEAQRSFSLSGSRCSVSSVDAGAAPGPVRSSERLVPHQEVGDRRAHP